MIDQLTALIVDEGKWLTASLGIALLSVSGLLTWSRPRAIPARRRVLASMTLFFGVTIGCMAAGHLLAVTTKLLLGSLEGSALAFYGIGVALLIPSACLARHARQVLVSDQDQGRATWGLNAWLVATLLALGLHNAPLAAPGVLNIAYSLHARRVVGWVIVGLAVVVGLGLFIASLVFLASGQGFEQFRGMP